MLKKFLIVLLSLVLVACDSSQTEIDESYIEPIKDVFLFGELDANTQVDIKKANGNKDFDNYQFKALNKDIYQDELTDIYGNSVNLKDYSRLVIAVVSIECGHCKKFISERLDDMLSKDIQLVLYFNVGRAESIIVFFEELNIEIPDKAIIIASNANLHDYIVDYLKLEINPTLLSFVDGKLTFMGVGDYDSETIEYFYNMSFINILTDLKDMQGNDLLSLYRDTDDVKDSLSTENQEKLSILDNDLSSISATYKIMGSKCNFDYISNKKSEVYINEVDDFSAYNDKDLVLFYVFLRDETETNKIEFINSLIDSNNDYEYIVVLIEGLESGSNTYKNMSIKFNCPCVSTLGYMPDDFYKVGLTAYPSALFIRKGTFTGAYSNIESIDDFNYALDIFLSDNCIALTRNN